MSVLESLCERPFADDAQPQAVPARALPHAAPPAPASPPGFPPPQGTGSGEAAPMAADALAAILSGTAAPEQVEAFHQAAAASDALRLEAQSALAFVDAIEQAPLAAPALLVQQALAAERASALPSLPGVRGRVREGASLTKSSIWAQLLPRRQVAAACVMLLMAGGLTWSLIGHEAEAPHNAASPPLPATVPAVVPAAVPADNRELDTIVRSKAPASEMAPLVAPRSDSVAPAAAGTLPPPVATPTPLPGAALPPPKPLADPCAPGFANAVAPGEAGSPGDSQAAQSPTPAAGSQMKTAAVPAGEPGCPPGEGRAVLGTPIVTPEPAETVEGPRNQKSDKARANRAASRKAAVDRPAPLVRRPSVQSLPERAR